MNLASNLFQNQQQTSLFTTDSHIILFRWKDRRWVELERGRASFTKDLLLGELKMESKTGKEVFYDIRPPIKLSGKDGKGYFFETLQDTPMFLGVLFHELHDAKSFCSFFDLTFPVAIDKAPSPKPKADAADEKSAVEQTWSCTMCTFKNITDANECAMCETKKPQSATMAKDKSVQRSVDTEITSSDKSPINTSQYAPSLSATPKHPSAASYVKMEHGQNSEPLIDNMNGLNISPTAKFARSSKSPKRWKQIKEEEMDENGGSTKVLVVPMDQAPFLITVATDADVLGLKFRISQMKNIPLNQQTLLYRDRALKDTDNLESIGYQFGDMISLVLQPPKSMESNFLPLMKEPAVRTKPSQKQRFGTKQLSLKDFFTPIPQNHRKRQTKIPMSAPVHRNSRRNTNQRPSRENRSRSYSRSRSRSRSRSPKRNSTRGLSTTRLAGRARERQRDLHRRHKKRNQKQKTNRSLTPTSSAVPKDTQTTKTVKRVARAVEKTMDTVQGGFDKGFGVASDGVRLLQSALDKS